jgi:tetratricopeptide (TPR) repeat protein
MAVAMWPFLWIAGLLTEGVEMYQAVLDETTLNTAERADALLGFGMLSFGRGDYERAAPALATAIDLYTELGDVRLVATASVPLGVMRAVQEHNGGEDLLTDAAETFRDLNDQWGLAFTLLNLGGALLLHDRYAEAVPYLEESVQLARAVKAEDFLSNALINLGLARLGFGDLDSARQLLREPVQHAAGLENTRESLARALDALAAVAVAADDFEHGATMLGAAEGVRHSIGAVLWVTDRTRHVDTETRLRARLSDSAYTEAIQRGRNLSLTEVLELTRLGDE